MKCPLLTVPGDPTSVCSETNTASNGWWILTRSTKGRYEEQNQKLPPIGIIKARCKNCSVRYVDRILAGRHRTLKYEEKRLGYRDCFRRSGSYLDHESNPLSEFEKPFITIWSDHKDPLWTGKDSLLQELVPRAKDQEHFIARSNHLPREDQPRVLTNILMGFFR